MMKFISLAVNGTLMSGLELNFNLLRIGATFIRETKTAPTYRLWSINNRYPAMIQVISGGSEIAVELWSVPQDEIITILLQEPPGLCLGKVKLLNGEEVLGILGEPILREIGYEITQWQGWRAYINSLNP